MIEVMRKIIDEQMGSYGLSDLKIGTVVSESPLKIRLNDRITLNENQILLTEFVLEKALKLIHKHGVESVNMGSNTHTHSVSGNTEVSDPEQHKHAVNLNTSSYSHSHSLDLTIKDNLGSKIIIQEGLKTNDKVIMMSAEKGQKYIVLSKLRDKKKVLIDCITGNWDWS